MWKLTEIYAQNICAFRELHYLINQGATTLIFGENKDNESQRSNGSGKSALIECIAIGITGSPLRKVKNEEIINDNSDESLIELTFENKAINERFMIERKLYRKGTSEVACYVFHGKDFKADEAIQPSIDAYNKYILEVLGISKDELYNNFLLSKHKYRDFLSSSDKEKKEIINRFSSGNMVDQAIDAIITDKKPVCEVLAKTDIELAGVNGRIEMLKEQIAEEEKSLPDKNRMKEERISKLRSSIEGVKIKLKGKVNYLGMLETELLKIRETEILLQELENSDLPLDDILSKAGEIIPLVALRDMTDWNSEILKKKDSIHETEIKLKECNGGFDTVEKEVNEITESYLQLQEDFKIYSIDNQDKQETYNGELLRFSNEFDRINKEITLMKQSRRNMSVSFESLHNKLAGIITCPSCKHEFLVSEKGFDVEAGKNDLNEICENIEAIEKRINTQNTKLNELEEKEHIITQKKHSLSKEKAGWITKLQESESAFKNASFRMEQVNRSQQQISGELNQLHGDIDGILKKVFDEGFELIDEALRQNSRNKNSTHEEIESCNASIDTMKATIKQLELTKDNSILASLEKSLEENHKKSIQILIKKTKLEDELGLLDRQERNFIEFKTYLANTKIEALSKITNEFLENIGSDIRVRLSGYTVLKSGKVRDKISVSLVRSGIDCGSFGKFSPGEAARVNLATILAMQKLINSNCETDKGLDLLVLDEILEAVDEEGLAYMFHALNSLGNTALVVSHGKIAESYPHKVKITKENGESRIDENKAF